MQRRYPVIYKNTALMPMKAHRARSLVKNRRAVFVHDKIIGTYVRLKEEPSGYERQDLALGIDYGTMWDGYSVANANNSHNYELEHSRKVKDKNFIKKKTMKRADARRVRRSRLWHREARFDNRTGSKVTKTMNYYYQEIRNMVERLTRFYPVADIVIEDVAAIHIDSKTRGFSPLEQIKSRLYAYLDSKAHLHISHANPKKIRLFKSSLSKTNGSIRYYDLKTNDKSEKSFYAHCIDSHSLACLVFGRHLPFINEIVFIYRCNIGLDNNRRRLERERASEYKKKKNGIEPKKRGLSKLRRIRVKMFGEQGNHGPWEYLYTVQEPTRAKTRSTYGSSMIHESKSSWKLKTELVNNKYYEDGVVRYYEIEVIKSSEISNHLTHYLCYEIPQECVKRVESYRDWLDARILSTQGLGGCPA